MTASRIVVNSRPGLDALTCGQAAVATVLAHHRLGPFAANPSISDGGAIDFVLRTYPPDLPFALGTTAFRLADALRSFGLGVERVHSGWFGRATMAALGTVRTHAALGYPVPVCVDDGLLGGAPGSAHWAVLLACDGSSVRLGNCRHAAMSLHDFLRVWRCRALPWPHNHCALIAWS
jgi:hypothetical protein